MGWEGKNWLDLLIVGLDLMGWVGWVEMMFLSYHETYNGVPWLDGRVRGI